MKAREEFSNFEPGWQEASSVQIGATEAPNAHGRPETRTQSGLLRGGGPQEHAPVPMAETGRGWRRVLLGLGLFFLVWGGKLVVIDHWGSDLPESDDWPAVGLEAIVPWTYGTFGLAHLFAAHNEHRVAVTRGLNLALAIANGQWDARFECVVNAALHALMAVGAYFLGARLLSRAARVAWFVMVAVWTAPPVVWENIVRGFDSQHYLLIATAVATSASWLTSRTGSVSWWTGLGCAVIGLFTMASGLVAPVIVIGVLFLTLPWRDVWRLHRWTVFAGATVAAAGVALSVRMPGGEALRAHHVAELWTAFYHHLQWPQVQHPLFGVISFLPWGWFTIRRVARHDLTAPGDRVVIAIGAWALSQYVAMAYMRGSLQPWPPVRGLENVVVGLLVNLYILLLVWSRTRIRGWKSWVGLAAACGGVGVCFHGLAAIIRENTEIVLPARRARVQQSEVSTRGYLLTGNRDWLKSNRIPFPSPAGLVNVLELPEIRALLPASVRPSLAIAQDGTPADTFANTTLPREFDRATPDRFWSSYSAVSGAASVGHWRSQPISPGPVAYWRFEIAGTPSAPGLGLELRSRDGQLLARLWPTRLSPKRWSSVTVARPDVPAVLIARDESASAWLAFTAPVEVAAGSMAAHALGRHGWWFAGLGATASLLGLLISGRRDPDISDVRMAPPRNTVG